MKTQWQIYKELELIPDSVPEPYVSKLAIALQLDRVWRSLLDTLARRPSSEQPAEYLERCFALDCFKRGDKNSDVWHKVWAFLNQPLTLPQLCSESEPQVWQSSDSVGRMWWHVYDPLTGQVADLESEEEVRIWLEERLYRYQNF